jgi:hypothetical protein
MRRSLTAVTKAAAITDTLTFSEPHFIVLLRCKAYVFVSFVSALISTFRAKEVMFATWFYYIRSRCYTCHLKKISSTRVHNFMNATARLRPFPDRKPLQMTAASPLVNKITCPFLLQLRDNILSTRRPATEFAGKHPSSFSEFVSHLQECIPK